MGWLALQVDAIDNGLGLVLLGHGQRGSARSQKQRADEGDGETSVDHM
jgi:hypothetical protein